MSNPRRRSRFRSVIEQIREAIAENDARLDAIEDFLGINNFTMSEEGNIGIGSTASGNVGVGSTAPAGNVGVGSTPPASSPAPAPAPEPSSAPAGNVGVGTTGNIGIGSSQR